MDYHKNRNRIWKIWDLIDIKIKEATAVTFDKIFSNKVSEELFKSLTNNSDHNDSDQNDFDQELNIEVDTNSHSDGWESVLQIQKLISDLVSLLSSFLTLPL